MTISDELLFRDDPWATEGRRLSYSHWGEDRILAWLFKDRQRGFYVDFGCFHPTVFSNTYFLYQKGWRGLNIDANPETIDNFNREREGDMNLNVAIAETSSDVDFYFFDKHASSNTTSKVFAESITKKQNIAPRAVMRISAFPSDEIFNRFVQDRQIDYWNIDLEGADFVALTTNNWSRYRPSVISVEDFNFRLPDGGQSSEIYKYLTLNDYSLVSHCIYTFFYVDKTRGDRLYDQRNT